MTRGCPNTCTFCAVPKLEREYCDYIGIKSKIQKVEECFGAKRDLLLMDNNVFASECFNKIIDEIKDCGFAKGATYIPANEYEISYRNLCYGFKLGEGKAKNVYNERAYIKKLIRIYDEITEKLSGEDKVKFYSKREDLGILYPETAKKENITIFHEIAKNLYDKLFKHNQRVRFIDFNQGLDGRLATGEKMKKISEVAIRPLRIAFDHIKMKDIYERAVRTAVEHGIRDLSNYLLYNYTDHPDELYERMRLNVELCDELGVAIYSFPMKYHPISDPEYFRNRDYIGKPHWNRKFIRAVQAVLNSTHGKIGRGRTFFEAAFGKNMEEFHKILWMPEALIIQRYKYDKENRNEYYGNAPTPYDNIDEEMGASKSETEKRIRAMIKSKKRSLFIRYISIFTAVIFLATVVVTASQFNVVNANNNTSGKNIQEDEIIKISENTTPYSTKNISYTNNDSGRFYEIDWSEVSGEIKWLTYEEYMEVTEAVGLNLGNVD